MGFYVPALSSDKILKLSPHGGESVIDCLTQVLVRCVHFYAFYRSSNAASRQFPKNGLSFHNYFAARSRQINTDVVNVARFSAPVRKFYQNAAGRDFSVKFIQLIGFFLKDRKSVV